MSTASTPFIGPGRRTEDRNRAAIMCERPQCADVVSSESRLYGCYKDAAGASNASRSNSWCYRILWLVCLLLLRHAVDAAVEQQRLIYTSIETEERSVCAVPMIIAWHGTPPGRTGVAEESLSLLQTARSLVVGLHYEWRTLRLKSTILDGFWTTRTRS